MQDSTVHGPPSYPLAKKQTSEENLKKYIFFSPREVRYKMSKEPQPILTSANQIINNVYCILTAMYQQFSDQLRVSAITWKVTLFCKTSSTL